MTVKELIEILQKANPEADVKVRYVTEVEYSSWTGEETVLGEVDKEAVIIDKKHVIFAADLCECKYERQ